MHKPANAGQSWPLMTFDLLHQEEGENTKKHDIETFIILFVLFLHWSI